MTHLKFSGKPADAWSYITGGLANIENKKRHAAMGSLLDCFGDVFCTATAAEHHHHAVAGGLAHHTAEVIDWSLRLFDEFGGKLFGITAENVYIAAALHDLSKIHQYKHDENGVFEYNRGWQFEPDIWVIAEANKFGLQLNYDEMMGIIQAHGGWSKMRNPISPLGVLVHLADMISSQLLK